MTRSPLFYPLNRGMDAEAGGSADLQTDVMRFIAILALCLVAIFALVQSIPLMPTYIGPPAPAKAEIPQPDLPPPVEPQPATTEPVAAGPVIVEEKPPPRAREEKPLVITRPAPRRVAVLRSPPRIIEQTIAPQPAETIGPVDEVLEPVVSEPSPPQPTAPAKSGGFTLRFETDLALTRLVARNEVGLYAITPEKSLRMNVNRGSLSFWPASVPNQFHEMEELTVPEDVRGALRRTGSVKIGDVEWGVTLSREMRKDLERYLGESSGGSLIIGGNGRLRLEP
jgi:hypothetical protein